MSIKFKNISVLSFADALMITIITMFTFMSFVSNIVQLLLIIAWTLIVFSTIFYIKGIYNLNKVFLE